MDKYEKQNKWREKNLRIITFSLNKEKDKALIEFVENNKATYGIGNIMRDALTLLYKSKKGSMTPTYFREYYHNGDKVEMFDEKFKLIKVVNVMKDKFGEIRLLSDRKEKITENLIRVVRKSDAVEAFLETKPIEGTDEYLEVVGSKKMTDEQRENFSKNVR